MVQQLTGQLGQQIRTSQNISSDDIKGTLNSILAAAKGKLQPDAVSDIQKKLNDAVAGGEAAPAQGQDQGQTTPEQPVQEEVVEEDTDIMSNGLIQDIIRRAHLERTASEFPEGFAFELCEAIYVFVMDYNDNSDFINKLKVVLRNNQFKASPMITGFDDLSEEGQQIYNTLVQLEQDILKPKRKSTIPKFQQGFSLNESQKNLILSKLKSLD